MELNNTSEVLNTTVLNENYRLKEHEKYTTYRPVACTFGLIIMLSNLTVVVSSGLILKKGQQRKSTYILLGNVSLADTIIGMSMLIGFSFENPDSSNPLCIFELGMLVCPAMVSIFTVGLIAVDRYIYILHGLYYQRWVNTTKVRVSIMFIWLIGLTLGFLPATGWTNHDLNSNCFYVAVFPGPLILLNSILSIVPIIVVAVLYSIILVSALKNIRKINASVAQAKTNTKSVLRIYRGNGNNTQSVKTSKRNNQNIKRSLSFNSCYEIESGKLDRKDFVSKSNTELTNETFQALPNKDKTSCNNVSNSLCSTNIGESRTTIGQDTDSTAGQRTKDVGRVKTKEANKWRALTIVMLTTGSFIFTWMPFFIAVIFYVLCDDKEVNPKCLHIRLLLAGPLAALAFMNSIFNPLIYVWWHKGFQRYVQTCWKRYISRHFKGKC
ncbi:5-hydroxytryptamine receptor 1A-alpha-like [Pieris napi]|uniref:5-hydroxytryptamine receptor 1A-alpha-like n=1 Tax=Pieris napi TaxID=78633 RepID=UPI001FB98AC0|nr:5-hydroxytryptamine receptor 1A-alpha-like [Pieris napi]